MDEADDCGGHNFEIDTRRHCGPCCARRLTLHVSAFFESIRPMLGTTESDQFKSYIRFLMRIDGCHAIHSFVCLYGWY